MDAITKFDYKLTKKRAKNLLKKLNQVIIFQNQTTKLLICIVCIAKGNKIPTKKPVAVGPSASADQR